MKLRNCHVRNYWILRFTQNDEGGRDVRNDWILRCAQNDEDAMQKKEDSTVVESSFCGCQDSNLEQYEDRTSLHRDKIVLARPLANPPG